MEKVYRVHVYKDGELIDKWRITERQKQIIDALFAKDLLGEKIYFVCEEEKNYIGYKDFT